MKDKRPALMFYVGDWMKSETRAVSLAARGLWIDMLCVMHECEPRGYLQHPSGEPFSAKEVARMVGVRPEQVAKLWQEMESCGVFSRTEKNVIFCRRMVRDEQISQARSIAGKAGMAKRYGNVDITKSQQTPNKRLTALEKLSSSSSSSIAASSSKQEHPPTPQGGAPAWERRFDRFYSAYPKKKSRGAAEKVFKALAPDDALVDLMVEAIGRQKETTDWRKEGGQFIPYPATWLTRKGWLDETATSVEIGLKPELEYMRKTTKFEGPLMWGDANLDEGETPTHA